MRVFTKALPAGHPRKSLLHGLKPSLAVAVRLYPGDRRGRHELKQSADISCVTVAGNHVVSVAVTTGHPSTK